MISKPDILKLISKYALILIILYLIQYVIDFSIDYYLKNIEEYDQTRFWISITPTLIYFVLNIVTALIVRSDINRIGLKSRFLTLMTLLWRPLGICLFFISVLYQSKSQEIASP